MAKNEKTAAGELEAKTAQEQKTAFDPEELVEYMVSVVMGGEDSEVYACVNGENIRFRRGVTVKIKRKFVEVLKQSAEQEMAAYQYRQKMKSDGLRAMAEL